MHIMIGVSMRMCTSLRKCVALESALGPPGQVRESDRDQLQIDDVTYNGDLEVELEPP